MTEHPKRAIDQANLDAALTLIRQAHPTATGACFTTSDQALYGFLLQSIDLPDGDVSQDAAIWDQVNDLVCDIDWDGVMGEDVHGDVTIRLGGGPGSVPVQP